MIQLAVGDQDKIRVIWALLLLLLWAILVIDPDINIDIPVDLLVVKELHFETCVSKPFEINLSLQCV